MNSTKRLMDWRWKQKGNGAAEANEDAGTNLRLLVDHLVKFRLAERGKGMEDVSERYKAALVCALELLKGGAPSVDMHPWGIRVLKLHGDWAIIEIPESARTKYGEMLLREESLNAPAPPIDGEEDSIEPDEPTGVRVTS